MKCGHCKAPDVDIGHALACAGLPADWTQDQVPPDPEWLPSKRSRRNKERKEVMRELGSLKEQIAAGRYTMNGQNYVVAPTMKPSIWMNDGTKIPGGVVGEYEAYVMLAADPQAAMMRFGRETGECGKCSRPLKAQATREAGMHERCMILMGWLDERMRA